MSVLVTAYWSHVTYGEKNSHIPLQSGCLISGVSRHSSITKRPGILLPLDDLTLAGTVTENAAANL
jgi:hypothetical protein